MKTLLFAFFSINSIYFLFLYTDIFSTLLVTLSFYLVLQKKYTLSGLLCIFSLVVRQTNIFFMGFLYTVAYMQDYGFKVDFKNLAEYFKKTIVYIAGFAGFVIYYILNPSISYGLETKIFSSPKLSFNNIYFILFLYFYLFLPENIALLAKTMGFVKKRLLYIIAGTGALFMFFIYTFQNIHPWNVTPHLLRNIPMIIFTSNFRSKTVFFVVMLFSILSLCVVKLHKKQYGLVYIFSFLMLMWIWLVEPRYYMLPFALFILVKKVKSGKMLFLTILLNALISIYLIDGTFSLRFYP